MIWYSFWILSNFLSLSRTWDNIRQLDGSFLIKYFVKITSKSQQIFFDQNQKLENDIQIDSQQISSCHEPSRSGRLSRWICSPNWACWCEPQSNGGDGETSGKTCYAWCALLKGLNTHRIHGAGIYIYILT